MRLIYGAERIAVGAALVVVVLPAATALAAVTTGGTVLTAPAAEAWYRTSAACTTAIGCPPTSGSYPAGTFHVGVTLGAEDARSYLQLDLTKLPAGALPTGGRLRLPLAPSRDGTSSPDTARLRACFAPGPVTTDEGTVTSTPPKADCARAAVDAVYEPARGDVPAAFVVDLTSLASVWRRSPSPGGLALLPAAANAQTSRWQLAFNEHDRRDGSRRLAPTARVSFSKPASAVEVSSSPMTAPPTAAPGLSPVQQTAPVDVPAVPAAAVPDSPGSVLAPAVAGDPPAPLTSVGIPQPLITAQPLAAAPQELSPVALVGGRFRYPVVFLLPLLLAGAVGWLGRALTRDLPAV